MQTHTLLRIASAAAVSATTPAMGASVAALSPADGPNGGGITVTIDGIGFAGATAVDFGGIPGTNLKVVSDTELTVTAPAPAKPNTAVSVTIDTPAGPSDTAVVYQYDGH